MVRADVTDLHDDERSHVKPNGTSIVHDDPDAIYSETKALLSGNHNDKQEPAGDGYKRYSRLDIQVTCLHWLIAPICFAAFFAMVSSYYAITEYTKYYFQVREFEKANLSLETNISDSTCSVDPDDIYYQTETKATSEASKWNSYLSLAGGIPSIFANLVLGAYTDSLGRKFLLIFSILGSSIRLTIAAVVVYLEADLTYLIIASVVEGLSGQHATILQTSLAYVADITDPGKKRILGIVYVEVAVGFGLSIATFVTGFIIDAIGYEFAMIISAGVLVCALLLVVFVLPETLEKKHKRKDRSVLTNIKSSFRFFIDDDSSKRRWKYQVVVLAHVLINLSCLGRLNTETLYQLASPFCWSPTKVGVYAALRTLALMILGLGSVKLLQCCMDDIAICMLGTISYAAAFYWTAFASDDTTLYIIILVGCFGPLSVTMQRSILSHMTPPENQGAIFTAVGVIEVSSFMIAGTSNAAIYAVTVGYMRGLVFLVMGSYAAASLVLLVFLKVRWSLEKRQSGFQHGESKEIVIKADNYGATEKDQQNSYRTSALTE